MSSSNLPRHRVETGLVLHLSNFEPSVKTHALLELSSSLSSEGASAGEAADTPPETPAVKADAASANGTTNGTPSARTPLARKACDPTIRWIDETSALLIFPAGACEPDERAAALMAAAAKTDGGMCSMIVQSYDQWEAKRRQPAQAAEQAQEMVEVVETASPAKRDSQKRASPAAPQPAKKPRTPGGTPGGE